MSDKDKLIHLKEKASPFEKEDSSQRTRRIYTLFRQLDDSQGYLDTGNITKKLDELVLNNENNENRTSFKSNRPLGSSAMYARELVKVCDQTQNGRVTFEEFEEFITAKEHELWDLFHQVDVGNDNGIHLHDLQTSMRNAGLISFHGIVFIRL